MRRNLKYAVCRGVDDQFSSAQVFLAIVGDNLRAGIGFIAQHTPAHRLLESVDYFRRKSIGIDRQRLCGVDARNLPMADGRIFFHGTLRSAGQTRRQPLLLSVQVFPRLQKGPVF